MCLEMVEKVEISVESSRTVCAAIKAAVSESEKSVAGIAMRAVERCED